MNRSNLEEALFSSSGDEEDEAPLAQAMQEYMREYSLIFKEIENFFKEVKQNVQRFITFHNFGVSLSLPSLFKTLNTVESTIKQKRQSQKSTPQKLAQSNYENTFNKLLLKMGSLLEQFRDCQSEFKRKYMGVMEQEEGKNLRIRSKSPTSFSFSSMTHSSKSSDIKKKVILRAKKEEQDQSKKEADLRATLNEKLKPKLPELPIDCKAQYSTTENLYRLNEKVERILQDMKSSNNREDKLIQLFNMNRVKKAEAWPIEQATSSSVQVSAIFSKESSCGETDEVQSFLQQLNPRGRRESGSEWGGQRCFAKRGRIA